jgi:hypothetical protein
MGKRSAIGGGQEAGKRRARGGLEESMQGKRQAGGKSSAECYHDARRMLLECY